MGNITPVCKKGDKDIQINNLYSKLRQQKKRTKKALEEASRQKFNTRNYELQVDQYEEDMEKYRIKVSQYEEDMEKYRIKEIKLNKYESTIKYTDALATHILSTKLNCRWMNDEYEKEYLIAIFDYIKLSMDDPSFNLQQSNESEHESLESIKNINQIYTQFDNIEIRHSDDVLL
jgi:hypothetical protein